MKFEQMVRNAPNYCLDDDLDDVVLCIHLDRSWTRTDAHG